MRNKAGEKILGSLLLCPLQHWGYCHAWLFTQMTLGPHAQVTGTLLIKPSLSPSIIVSSSSDSHSHSSNDSSGDAGIEPWDLNLQAKGSDHSASTQSLRQVLILQFHMVLNSSCNPSSSQILSPSSTRISGISKKKKVAYSNVDYRSQYSQSKLSRP